MIELNSIISVKNLCKDFVVDGKVFHALKNINLDVEAKDIYGIIGLSGAGKSTLIRCINLLEVPTSGTISFLSDALFEGDSKKVFINPKLNQYRRKMGMIFQNFNLLDQRNVLKNVMFPLEIAGIKGEIAKEKAIKLLKMVGLEERIYAYPSQLSGGQKQRVAIARALANDPEVLLCDEPTSALDPNTTNQILQLLKTINETLGVTIIIITHEMKVIEAICNKVSIIDNSEIVEGGFVKDIFKNPQSNIAKQLVLPMESFTINPVKEKKYLRLVFDGTVDEPIISNLILTCNCELNILSSNVKTFENKVYGQMIIQIPDDSIISNRIISFLLNKQILVEEVDDSGSTVNIRID